MIYPNTTKPETHPFFKTTAHERLVAERDRLRAVNDELLKVVVECADLLHFMTPREGYSPDGALAHARAAIAKQKQGT